MTRLARTERSALCDTALQVGEGAPTLCDGWDAKDLVVHLLLREGSPAAAGIFVPRLSGLADRASARIGRGDFAVLVERLRGGPPLLSPFRVPKVDTVANTLEMFIHHEDLRRAQREWEPRVLGDEAERTLWSSLRPLARRMTAAAPVGVRIEETVTGSTAELLRVPSGEAVTVRGLPSEIALFVSGRQSQARPELLGDPDAVTRLSTASLGG